jgi:DNA-binding transcriptional LysR family regulator
MDYNDIPLFVHVVEAGGFTAAARALGREKSAVSRSVARLEEDLGVRLLQRTTRKLSLTEAGQAFFDRVRGAVAGVDEAASTVRELGTEPRGVVRLSAPSDAHTFGLAQTIARFVEKYPTIHVELTLTNRTVDLVAEGFDLAIRAGKLGDSTLIVRRMGSSTMHLFASPAYVKKQGAPETLAELARHSCVLFRAHGGSASWTLTGPNGEETVEVHGGISADEMAFVASAVIAGAGVGRLPIELARAFMDRGDLEVVLHEYRVTGASINIVMPTAAFVPTRVTLLRDHLIKEIEQYLATANLACRKAEAHAVAGARPRESKPAARRLG